MHIKYLSIYIYIRTVQYIVIVTAPYVVQPYSEYSFVSLNHSVVYVDASLQPVSVFLYTIYLNSLLLLKLKKLKSTICNSIYMHVLHVFYVFFNVTHYYHSERRQNLIALLAI